MKLYIERRKGMIHVQQKVTRKVSFHAEWYLTLRKAKDTPKNYKDILRWADAVGHTLEKKPRD